jgi:tRNA (guanine-N7-)-methyltransferase
MVNTETKSSSADSETGVKTPSQPFRRARLALTRDLRRPTEYVQLMNGEYADRALNEERAPRFKGRWREEVIQVASTAPVDLEIGTGNGYHFAHLAKQCPERTLLGLEIKFKPLIQSIRRALARGARNAWIIRYDAVRLEDIFAVGEIDNIYIHHPDPWPKKRQWKHRLIQADFLRMLYSLQRPGAFVDFKTDSEEYYDWAIEFFRQSPYTVSRETRDLHRSDWKDENFITHFESIFLSKGQPIFYARLQK